MTLNELIEALADLVDTHGDAQVLIGHQPNWPLAEVLDTITADTDLESDDNDPTAPDEPAVVWIVAGGHPDFRSPYAPRSLFTDAF